MVATRPILQALRDGDAQVLANLIEAGTLEDARIRLTLNRNVLAKAFSIASNDIATDIMQINRPIALRRRGVEASRRRGETGNRGRKAAT